MIHTVELSSPTREAKGKIEFLKQRVEQLENFIEYANIAMHWVGEDGTILWANRAELEMMGYKAHQYIGHKIMEFHASGSPIDEILDRLIRNEKLQAFPAKLKTRKGEILDVEIYSSVRFDNDKFIHTRCFTYDVTEKIKAQKAINEKSERFSLMADAVPQIIWTTTAAGDLDYVNLQGLEYAKISLQEARSGKFFEKCLHPSDYVKVLSQWNRSLRTGLNFEMEFRLVRQADQTSRWHLGRAFCKRDSNQKILFWAGTFTDIDDQRKLLEKTTRLGEHLEDIVKERTLQLEEAQSIAKIGTWVYTIHDDLIVLSPELKEIYALGDDLVNISFDEFINYRIPNERLLISKKIKDAIAARSSFEYECTILTANNETKVIYTRGRVKCNEMNEVLHVIGTVQDITKQREIEANLKMKNAELRRSNDELESFAYVASHDLKEPLRMISSYIQLIEKSLELEGNDPLKEYMSFVLQGSHRMQKLIDDLLKYSRIGRDSTFVTEVVNTNRLVNELLMTLANKIKDSNATVNFSQLPAVKGSFTLLSQLFQNLIVNALKFKGDKDPVINITAEKRNNMWKFTVSDNCIGIDPSYYNKIFMLFQRLHTADKYPGTGIGLAISKKIVELHGGEIWLESKIGQGTNFYFTLPL